MRAQVVPCIALIGLCIAAVPLCCIAAATTGGQASGSDTAAAAATGVPLQGTVRDPMASAPAPNANLLGFNLTSIAATVGLVC